MNIGFFTDTYFPQVNGVTYTIALWKEKLEEMGHNVFVYYPKSDYIPKKNEIPLKSIPFPFYKGYKIAFPWTKSINYLDVIHLHSSLLTIITAIYVSSKILKLQKKEWIPWFYSFHTLISDYYLKPRIKIPIIKEILVKSCLSVEKKIMRNCGTIIVPTPSMKEEIERYGINPNKIFVLSQGIDINFFKPINKVYNISKSKVIGYCGRIDYAKNLEDLINIADEFDGEIIIAGDGPAKRLYEKLVYKKNLKNIKFIGFIKREDLPEFYSSLDLFIFPSAMESQGLVALEAMACGTPVIGANARGLKNTIIDGKTGYLYEPGNTLDLLQKIQKGYKNRENLSIECLNAVKDGNGPLRC